MGTEKNHRWHLVQWINDVVFKGDELTKLRFWSGSVQVDDTGRASRFTLYMSGEINTEDMVEDAHKFQSQGAL